LVRLNGIPDAKAGGISSWLDELFRDIVILSSDTGNRSLAQTTDTNVLLEKWRRCRTKVRNLLKLGTPLEAAISVGLSRKDPWKLARTYATQIGMTNQWLKSRGLISVKELWVNIHYPATAR
jgi:hypothetical protein